MLFNEIYCIDVDEMLKLYCCLFVGHMLLLGLIKKLEIFVKRLY